MASENGKDINVTGRPNNGTNGTVGKNGTLRLNSSNPPQTQTLKPQPPSPKSKLQPHPKPLY